MSLRQKLSSAKRWATERCLAVDKYEDVAVFNSLESATQEIAEINELSKKLMASDKELKNLHLAWETHVSQLQHSNALQADKERQDLDEELTKEDGLTAFYKQVADAQAKLADCLSNAITQAQTMLATASTTAHQQRSTSATQEHSSPIKPTPEVSQIMAEAAAASIIEKANDFTHQAQATSSSPLITRIPINPHPTSPIGPSLNPSLPVFTSNGIPYGYVPYYPTYQLPHYPTHVSPSIGATQIPVVNQPALIQPQIFAPPMPSSLPRLRQPLFDGTPRHFRSWWQAFEGIHNNPSLRKVDKMFQLMNSLTGNAKAAFEGTDICNDNYDVVLKEIIDRYGNPEKIIESLYAAFDDITSKNDSEAEARRVVNAMDGIIRQLQAMNAPGMNDYLLLQYKKKLPSSMYDKVTANGISKTLAELQQKVKLELQIAEEKLLTHPRKDRPKTSFKAAVNGVDVEEIAKNVEVMAVATQKKVQSGKTEKSAESNSNASSTKHKNECLWCKGNHPSFKCKKTLSPKDRKSILKKDNRCFGCFKKDHQIEDCLTLRECDYCGEKHNKLFCESKDVKVNTVRIPMKNNESQKCLMPIKEAKIVNAEKTITSTAKVILDSGAGASFITSKLAEKCQLPIIACHHLEITRFGDDEETTTTVKAKLVQFCFKQTNGELLTVKAYIQDKLTGLLSCYDHKTNDIKMIEPDLLIGSDYCWNIITTEKTEEGYAIVKSSIGDFICGQINKNSTISSVIPDAQFTNVYSIKICQQGEAGGLHGISSDPDISLTAESEREEPSNAEMTKILNNFFEAEQLNSNDPPYDEQDDQIVKQVLAEATMINNRVQVKFPFTVENPKPPLNKKMAYSCLKSQLEKLMKEPELLKKVDELIKTQETDVIIEEVVDVNKITDTSYLPFLLVISSLKSTKIRMVFNASAKDKKSKLSLNDFLHAGPSLIPEIYALWLRLRVMFPILTIADIEKAFHQLLLHPEHRDYVRFLWIKDIEKFIKVGLTSDNIIEYRFARVLFGSKSSPLLLMIAIYFLYNQLKDESYANELKKDTYMDNIHVRASTATQAIERMSSLIELFADASMNLRDVVSNNKEVRLHFNAKDDPIKLLGYTWNPAKDKLIVKLQFKPVAKFTKRVISAVIGSIYDPIGLLTPVIVPLRAFLRKLWIANLKWDEIIPTELTEEWKVLEDQNITLEVPRFTQSSYESFTTELHVFVDASQLAYAAVAYIAFREINTGEATTYLLTAKAKLAPLKTVTTPRLELLAADYGVKLINHIREALEGLKVDKTMLWTDSSAVYYWIHSEKKLKRFVQNRVNAIKKCEDVETRHVPTLCNPADIPSRGAIASEIPNNQLWLEGPSWLKHQKWPEIVKISTTIKDDPDVISEFIFTAKVNQVNVPTILYPAEKSWSWIKTLRVHSMILKFIKKCRKEPVASNTLQEAEMAMIKNIQKVFPPTGETSKNLKLFVDANHVIRLSSRLQHCDNYDLANPIYLPSCPEANRLILHIHASMAHVGPKTVLTQLRQRFWIPHGMTTVKKVIRSCTGCWRWRAKPYQLPLMPNLPETRVKEHRPFEHIGIDAAGHFNLSGQNDEKRWVLLYTCFATRAVFLDVISSMSTESCIKSIIRFIGTYGSPKTIYSDHGTNFKGAVPCMKLFHQVLQDKALLDYASNQMIEWRFITERSPWKGGLYERLIGLMKSSLKHSIGRKKLSDEDFRTFVSQAQGIMNSRPLTDPDGDEPPIRPIDFLVPNTKLGIPVFNDEDDNDPLYIPLKTTKDKMLEALQKSTTCIDKLWKKWQKEYLIHLRDTSSLLHKQKGLEAVPIKDDVVIIEEENQDPRGSWRLGRVENVLKSNDGEIRAVTVVTKNGKLTRSPKHLYPLEANLEPQPSRSNQKITVNLIYYLVIVLCLFVHTSDAETLKNVSCINGAITLNAQGLEKLQLKARNRAKIFSTYNESLLVIPLPPKLAISGATVTLTAWSNSSRYDNVLQCPPIDYCDAMNCTFCRKFILNWHCWPTVLWMTIALIFFLILLAICKCCCKSPKPSIAVRIFRAGRDRWCKRETSKIETANEIELQNIVENKEPLEETTEADSLNNRKGFVYSKSFIRRTATLMVILSIIQQSYSITLQAQNEECVINEDGWATCYFSTKSLIYIPSEAEEVLLLQTTANTPMMTITIQAQILAECIKIWTHNTYFVSMDVESAKRCPSRGSCRKDNCLNIHPDDHIEELKIANDYPGQSYCQESCGTILCGCTIGTGCLFYRTYATYNEKQMFNVSKCAAWKPYANVILKIMPHSTGQEKVISRTLYEGQGFEENNITVILKKMELPFLHEFYTDAYFMELGNDIALIKDQAIKEAQLLTCKKTCRIQQEACHCHAADNAAVCACPRQSELRHQWTDNKLPIMNGQHLISKGKNNTPEAHIAGMLELIVETHDLTATEIINQAPCHVLSAEVNGVVGTEGAVLNITCQSTFGTTMAHITCSQSSFYAKCAIKPKVTLHRWYSNSVVVNENCEIKCSQQATSFTVKGKLHIVEESESWSTIHGESDDIMKDVLEVLEQLVAFLYSKLFMVIAVIALILVLIIILK